MQRKKRVVHDQLSNALSSEERVGGGNGEREREKELGNVVRESVSPRSVDVKTGFYRLLFLALLITM